MYLRLRFRLHTFLFLVLLLLLLGFNNMANLVELVVVEVAAPLLRQNGTRGRCTRARSRGREGHQGAEGSITCAPSDLRRRHLGRRIRHQDPHLARGGDVFGGHHRDVRDLIDDGLDGDPLVCLGLSFVRTFGLLGAAIRPL
jgi:hypothetical protein